jgi:predicted dehydrogenase
MAHGYPAEQADHLEMFGSEGAITLDRNQLRLRSARSGGSEDPPDEEVGRVFRPGTDDDEVELDLAANYTASYNGAITHFVDRLADGGAFETAPDDNLETLRIIEAAYQQGGSCVHSGGTLRTC